MNRDALDWKTLERLRALFLEGQPRQGSYWNSQADLETYDATFAQRIAWKWNAVLRELSQRGWQPPPGRPLLDWGCGSGIASRRVLEHFGVEAFQCLRVHDRSPLATDFAVNAAKAAFPLLPVESAPVAGVGAEVGVLVISHVLNELDTAAGRELRQAIDRADAVLWVEPGTHADSRALIALRESLRAEFVAIAPCPHQNACGLLAAENAPHWCHHFAEPPPGIMADSDWVLFAQRAGIDLRSLPYSFLVLERRTVWEQRVAGKGDLGEGWSHILGRPRIYKAFAKILSCQANGVREFELQKRDGPELFKALRKGDYESLYRWALEGNRIKSAAALVSHQAV